MLYGIAAFHSYYLLIDCCLGMLAESKKLARSTKQSSAQNVLLVHIEHFCYQKHLLLKNIYFIKVRSSFKKKKFFKNNVALAIVPQFLVTLFQVLFVSMVSHSCCNLRQNLPCNLLYRHINVYAGVTQNCLVKGKC